MAWQFASLEQLLMGRVAGSGVNGLEAGQSFVIACGILTMNVIEVMLRLGRDDCTGDCAVCAAPFSSERSVSPAACNALSSDCSRRWRPVWCFDFVCLLSGCRT